MERTARARYTALSARREPFLRRARAYAEITIPSLLPPQGHNGTQELPEPYQGFAASAISNLAYRLTAVLLPPNQQWFRLAVSPEALMQAGAQSPPADLERSLALAESVITQETLRRRWRQPTYIALQHLIVSGNALEMIMPDNTIRVFRLDQYVAVRDPIGTLVELVIEEQLSPQSLTDDLKALLPEGYGSRHSGTIPLYTWARLDANTGKWEVHQEINETPVPDSEGSYRISPFNALRWIPMIGEDYGRGKCEEHYGDLRALEAYSKASLDGAVMASRNLFLVSTTAQGGGINLARKLAKAENGDVLVGRPEDVQMLQFTNLTGMQYVAAERAEVKQTIARAFLLNSSVQRDAERVTAYELRMMAEEIEAVLGGVYTSLVADIQEARLRRLIFQMQAARKLPEWPDGLLEPHILTGMEALGREQDVQRVMTATQMLAGLPPEISQSYIKWPELLTKLMNGLNLTDVVNSQEEAAAIMQQQAAIQAMASAQMAQPTEE